MKSVQEEINTLKSVFRNKEYQKNLNDLRIKTKKNIDKLFALSWQWIWQPKSCNYFACWSIQVNPFLILERVWDKILSKIYHFVSLEFLDPLADLVTCLNSNIPLKEKFSLEQSTAIRVVNASLLITVKRSDIFLLVLVFF